MTHKDTQKQVGLAIQFYIGSIIVTNFFILRVNQNTKSVNLSENNLYSYVLRLINSTVLFSYAVENLIKAFSEIKWRHIAESNLPIQILSDTEKNFLKETVLNILSKGLIRYPDYTKNGGVYLVDFKFGRNIFTKLLDYYFKQNNLTFSDIPFVEELRAKSIVCAVPKDACDLSKQLEEHFNKK